MPNELLWLIFIVFDLSAVLLAFRLWGRNGLYAVIACSGIVCNIQVVVTVELFGMVATLGNIVYSSIFLATDILSEHYGHREARRGVWIGFYSLVWATVAMQFAIHFTPDESDFMLGHLQELFGLMPRVVVASLTAYLISQHHDIWSFLFWKRKTGGRYLWLRNNLSTWVSQLVDSVVFTVIAFLGVFEMDILLQIVITTYVLKIIVAVIDTPFLYASKKIAEIRSKQDFV